MPFFLNCVCYIVWTMKALKCKTLSFLAKSVSWNLLEFSRDPTGKFDLLHARRKLALEWGHTNRQTYTQTDKETTVTLVRMRGVLMVNRIQVTSDLLHTQTLQCIYSGAFGLNSSAFVPYSEAVLWWEVGFLCSAMASVLYNRRCVLWCPNKGWTRPLIIFIVVVNASA